MYGLPSFGSVYPPPKLETSLTPNRHNPKPHYSKHETPSFAGSCQVELPRAALQAGRLAEQAEFFSFGTNDLTQTTYGLSRDDAGRGEAMRTEGQESKLLDFELMVQHVRISSIL